MPEQSPQSPSERFSPAEHSHNFFELGLKTLRDRPDALKDLANNPEFVRSLDSMKSNPEVRAALDKAWNEALVSLYRAGFETAPAQKQTEMIRALPIAERTLLIAHVRDYDTDNGADLPPTDPNDAASLEAVAASMRKSMETAKNAEALKNSDIRGRFDSLKAGASPETAKLLEGSDVSTMQASDVARLRAEGVDLSKIFLVDAA